MYNVQQPICFHCGLYTPTLCGDAPPGVSACCAKKYKIQTRITRAAAFDPLAYVAATHGNVRMKIGGPRAQGLKGDGGDEKSEEGNC